MENPKEKKEKIEQEKKVIFSDLEEGPDSVQGGGPVPEYGGPVPGTRRLLGPQPLYGVDVD